MLCLSGQTLLLTLGFVCVSQARLVSAARIVVQIVVQTVMRVDFLRTSAINSNDTRCVSILRVQI